MAEISKTGKIKRFYSEHPLWSGLLTMAVVGLFLIWLILIFLDIWTHHGDDSVVPEVKHLTYGEAVGILNNADLEIEISDSIYDNTLPPGTIVESWPKAGSQVKRGRKVYVTLTSFSPKHVTLSMPITGVSSRQAISYLNALGINGIRIINVPSEYNDLVEGAHYNNHPLGVGSVVPVDANIVLEVGVYQAPDDSIDYEYLSDAEESVYEDLSAGQSVYIDE